MMVQFVDDLPPDKKEVKQLQTAKRRHKWQGEMIDSGETWRCACGDYVKRLGDVYFMYGNNLYAQNHYSIWCEKCDSGLKVGPTFQRGEGYERSTAATEAQNA